MEVVVFAVSCLAPAAVILTVFGNVAQRIYHAVRS